MSRKSSTETLIAAMRILARDIQSGDGVANAAIAEAADRLEEQQASINELEHQSAIGRRAVDVDRLHKLLAEVEVKLYEAYGRRVPECCGRGYGECCGDFVESWTDADNATMDALSPVRNELAAILRDAEQASGQGILDSSAPEPATAEVDAGALEALRSAMSKLRAPMSRTEYAVARAGIIEAAYRLMAGGE